MKEVVGTAVLWLWVAYPYNDFDLGVLLQVPSKEIQAQCFHQKITCFQLELQSGEVESNSTPKVFS